MALPQKILVTGATGLVGSHLLYALVKEGFVVKAMHRSPIELDKWNSLAGFYGTVSPGWADNIEWVTGDVTDYYSLIDALQGIDKVYHCAAMVSFDPRQKAEMFRVNQEGTANVVNACIETGIGKLCYVSSIGALGSPVNGDFIDEETAWQNDDDHSAYSWSKFMAEMEVWRGTKEGLPAVVVNPGVILGPSDVSRSSTAIFGRVEKGMKFYTNGVTGFVDVRDVADAMLQLMESDIVDERFVLVSENLTYKSLLGLIADAHGMARPSLLANQVMTEFAWRFDRLLCVLFGKKASFTQENSRTSHSKSYYSSRKIANKIGFRFRPIPQTIEETVGWLQSNGSSIHN